MCVGWSRPVLHNQQPQALLEPVFLWIAGGVGGGNLYIVMNHTNIQWSGFEVIYLGTTGDVFSWKSLLAFCIIAGVKCQTGFVLWGHSVNVRLLHCISITLKTAVCRWVIMLLRLLTQWLLIRPLLILNIYVFVALVLPLSPSVRHHVILH